MINILVFLFFLLYCDYLGKFIFIRYENEENEFCNYFFFLIKLYIKIWIVFNFVVMFVICRVGLLENLLVYFKILLEILGMWLLICLCSWSFRIILEVINGLL